MKEDKNQKQTTSPKKRRVVVVSVIALVLIVCATALGIITKRQGDKNVTTDEADRYDLSELHQFPPIEFNDSLYYEKVLTSYDNGEASPQDVFYYEKDSLGMPTDVKVHESHYYPGKKLFIDGNVAENQRNGLWYAYHKNGNVQTMAHYRNGKEDGRYVVYHENGSVYYTGMYKEGKRVGEWRFYDENEKFVRSQIFD